MWSLFPFPLLSLLAWWLPPVPPSVCLPLLLLLPCFWSSSWSWHVGMEEEGRGSSGP